MPAKPVFSLDQVVNQLDSGTRWSAQAVSYAFATRVPFGGFPGGENDGLSSFSSTQRIAATLAIELWQDLIGLDFVLASEGAANILFTNYDDAGQAYAYFPIAGDVFINDNQASNLQLDPGGYGLLTLIHEIGHSLGLNHPGNYDASRGGLLTYRDQAEYQQDSHQYSVMSYWDASNTGADHRFYYPSTPMVHDVYAIQSLYGANMSTRSGDTVYGFNSTADREVFDFSNTENPVVTLWDGGGDDTLDLSGYSSNSSINLNDGEYSSAGALTLNIAIAVNAMIENAVGGPGNDQIVGQELSNVLNGGGGNDRLNGGGGDDSLIGGSGSDTAAFSGSLGNYSISELGGGDYRISGPDGTDTLSGIELVQFGTSAAISIDTALRGTDSPVTPDPDPVPDPGPDPDPDPDPDPGPDPDPQDASDQPFQATVISLPTDLRQSVGFGTDAVDYFGFQADSDQQVRFDLSGLASDIDLYLYDAEGNLLAGSEFAGLTDESFSYVVATGQQYIVEVIPFDGPSEYRLQIEAEQVTDASDDYQAPTFVATPTDITQSVGIGDDEADYFAFFATVGGQLSLSLSGLSDDIDIYVYDEGGSYLASSNVSGSADESINVNVRQGQAYLVEVVPFLDASSNYRLQIEAGSVQVDADDEPFGDSLIGIPDMVSQSVGFGDDLADFFRLTAPESATLVVELTGLGTDIDLFLLDSAGDILASSLFESTSDERIFQNIRAGEVYYIGVLPFEGASDYLLSTRLVTDGSVEVDNNDSATTAVEISVPATLSETIGMDGDSADYFRFTTQSSGTLSVTLDGMSADADVFLLDANQQVLASSTSYGNTPETLALYTEAGVDYFVLVQPWDPDGTVYDLDLRISDNTTGQDAGEDIATATTMVLGTTIVQDVGGSDTLDMFRLTPGAYGLLTMNLDGLAADLDLLLLDAAGEIVASSLLAGTSPESIAYLANAGETYFLAVAPWEDAQSTYTLNAELRTDVLIYTDVIQSAYIAYYGRAADPGGLTFWLDELGGTSGDLGAIAAAFSAADEFLDRYGNLDSAALIDTIFEQLFGRDPDPEGLDFYVDSLESGSRSLSSITLDVLFGARNQDRAIVDNKVEIADYFTQLLGRSNFDYIGSDAANQVKQLFDQVTTDRDGGFLLVDEFFDQFAAGIGQLSSFQPLSVWDTQDDADFRSQFNDDLFGP